MTNHKKNLIKTLCKCNFQHLKKKNNKTKKAHELFYTSSFAVSSAESRLTVTLIGVPLIIRITDATVLTGSAFTWRLKIDRERSTNNTISINKNTFQSPNMQGELTQGLK